VKPAQVSQAQVTYREAKEEETKNPTEKGISDEKKEK
jgi:hypothetical protein